MFPGSCCAGKSARLWCTGTACELIQRMSGATHWAVRPTLACGNTALVTACMASSGRQLHRLGGGCLGWAHSAAMLSSMFSQACPWVQGACLKSTSAALCAHPRQPPPSLCKCPPKVAVQAVSKAVLTQASVGGTPGGACENMALNTAGAASVGGQLRRLGGGGLGSLGSSMLPAPRGVPGRTWP